MLIDPRAITFTQGGSDYTTAAQAKYKDRKPFLFDGDSYRKPHVTLTFDKVDLIRIGTTPTMAMKVTEFDGETVEWLPLNIQPLGGQYVTVDCWYGLVAQFEAARLLANSPTATIMRGDRQNAKPVQGLQGTFVQNEDLEDLPVVVASPFRSVDTDEGLANMYTGDRLFTFLDASIDTSDRVLFGEDVYSVEEVKTYPEESRIVTALGRCE